MKTLIVIVLAALAACSTGAIGPFTDPPAYLAAYPLGAPKQQVLREQGPPDEETTIDGRLIWSYQDRSAGDHNRWSFIFEDGAVYDVMYNTRWGGPWNGLTARTAQQAASP